MAVNSNLKSEQVSPRSTLIVVAAVQFLAPFMMSAVGVALPTIGRFYNASAVSLGLVEMVYVLALALFLLPMGRIADIYGRKKIFITGVALFALATALLPFAKTIEMFIYLRFLQGAGASLNISTSIAILSAVVPKERRGRAMGIIVACVYLGLSAGPTMAGMVIAYLGWQWIFFCAVPVALVALCLTILFLKGEWREAAGASFDYVGTLIYMASLFCLVVGVSHLKDLHGATLLAVLGCAGLVGFAFFEYHQASPIMDMRLIVRNRVLAFSNLATWINYAASFGLTFFFSLYLQVVKGMSPQTTGLLLIIQPGIQAILSPLAGVMADKYSSAKIATTGMIICSIGLALAAFINSSAGPLFVVLVLSIMGVGFALFASPNMTIIMGSVEPRHYGIASSLVATMRTIGMLSAMTIVTLLLSVFMGQAEVGTTTIPEYIQTMHTGFIVFAFLSTLGIACSMVRGTDS